VRVPQERAELIFGSEVDLWRPGLRVRAALKARFVPVPPEYSIGWLTCTVASRLETMMVGWTGAAQDRLRADLPGHSAWSSYCSAATGR
jgi:hypothetical protein